MPSIEEEIEAIVTPWTPSSPVESALERYLRAWETKVRPSSPNPEADVTAYRESVSRHCSRMESFLTSDESVFQGVVLGEVQAGKTGHLTASICWAASKPIHIMVVMSGTKLPLMNQTRKRLAKEIPGGVVHTKVVQPNYEEAALQALTAEVIPYLLRRLRGEDSLVPMFVTPKISRRLDALVQVVRALRESLPVEAPLNILVIDDEGDEASADTTASSRGRRARNRRGTATRAVRRAVHTCIGDLRNEASGQLIYLSYTATPQALMLGELDGILQPQYCSTVPSGSAYFGLDSAVDDASVFVPIPIPGAPPLPTPQEEIYYALEHAFAEFLIQAWLHYSHRDFFHSALPGTPACGQDGVQMLVHPSAVQDPQHHYRRYVDGLRDDWLRALSDGARREQLRSEYLVPAFIRVLDRFPESLRVQFGVHGTLLNECLQFAYEALADENQLQVWETNSREFARRLRSQEGRESLPSEDQEWQGPRAWVLVGGNLLGRGITVPHLVTSFFLRDPQSPNFDTTTQQMRFCGYRGSYESSIRVFAPQALLDIYNDIAVTDAPFRARARDWDFESTDLHETRPVSLFAVPSGSRLNLTRRNVVSGDVDGFDTSSVHNSGAFSTKHVASIARFISNADLLIERFGSEAPLEATLLPREGWHVNAFELPVDEMRGLLSRWSLADSDREGPGVLRDLLSWNRPCGGFGDERCIFLVDEPLLAEASGHALWTATRASAGRNWMSRTVGMPHGYQQTLSRLTAGAPDLEDGIEIPTVVGQSERSARSSLADAVVLHARGFGLRRDRQSPPDAFGIGLIGWVPNDSTVYSVNLEAAWMLDD